MKACHCLLLTALTLTAVPTARADTPAAVEFFEKEVRPLLVEHCVKCHRDDKVKGGLQLTGRAAVLRGGDSGAAVVPGKPRESLLIQAVRYDAEVRMPPKNKLKDEQIAVLARWVEMGAPWPGETATQPPPQSAAFQITAEQRRFWSFQPVRLLPAPAVKNAAWARSPIDRWVLAGLEAQGLQPAAPADRHTLIRRAYFDLIGLPPPPAELAAALADPAADWFDRLVERLLATPQYGQRWGRHWLDVVRYTDSADARGIGGPMDFGDAWRYRDWVVAAFNRDLPYDQFILHQLAGDIIGGTDFSDPATAPLVATGMLVIGNWGGGDADKEKLLTDIVDDQIDVVSRAFLGLTMSCARCHDHKFDPLSMEDYYGLAGIFFSTHILPEVGAKGAGAPIARVPLAAPAAVAQRQQYEMRMKALPGELRRTAARQGAALLHRQPLAGLAAFAASDPARLPRLQAELAALQQAPPPAIAYCQAAQEGGVPRSPHAGIHDVKVHLRGRYDRLGVLVPRRFPTVLAGAAQTPIRTGSGRLQLAQWLMRPDHPLTARVMVNRVWQGHFGEGLVRTPGNFGKLGERPSHPELLDFLARTFIDSGWSIKALHRTILQSATYQQASVAQSATLQADPENRLLGRMNRRRLEAEAVRDNLIAVTGRLDARLNGPATRDFSSPRRTLYQMTIRSDRSTFRELFDAADSTAIVDKRVVSTVAPQALFLLNHPLVQTQATTLARRIQQEAPAEPAGKIDRLYELLYGRLPSTAERAIGLEAVAQGWEAYCHLLLCANEFIYVD